MKREPSSQPWTSGSGLSSASPRFRIGLLEGQLLQFPGLEPQGAGQYKQKQFFHWPSVKKCYAETAPKVPAGQMTKPSGISMSLGTTVMPSTML